MPKINRVLGTLAAIAAATLLGPAPAAFAQAGDLDCRDFTYQEDAQAVYDADESDPNGLDGNDNDGIACESLPHRPAQQTPTSTITTTAIPTTPASTSRDKDCADFATQAQAQAELNKNPSDPNRLDADNDGYACESKFGEATTSRTTTGQVKVKPVGGVDTGGGDTGSDGGAGIALGGVALAGAAAGTVLVIRRRAHR